MFLNTINAKGFQNNINIIEFKIPHELYRKYDDDPNTSWRHFVDITSVISHMFIKIFIKSLSSADLD